MQCSRCGYFGRGKRTHNGIKCVSCGYVETSWRLIEQELKVYNEEYGSVI